MNISNSRRILAIGAPGSGVLNILEALTGSRPRPTSDTTAGLTHSWKLETSYYAVEIPIWIDEIQDYESWGKDFSSQEAREVVQAVGGWIFCFRKPISDAQLTQITATARVVSQVIRKACGYSWDGVCMAVATPQSETPHLVKPLDEWEDLFREYDFEYIDSEARGRNEFSEPTGSERLREALEANDWACQADEETDGLLDQSDDGAGSDGVKKEEEEMGMEFAALKSAIQAQTANSSGKPISDEDEYEEQVDGLATMMSKLYAAREHATGLPEAERKRLAAKTAGDIMKTL